VRSQVPVDGAVLGLYRASLGEMAALRVHRIDFLRRRVLVVESVTPVAGRMMFGPTKGHERREVPLPPFLIDDLARQVGGRYAGDLSSLASEAR
jgi:integrase